MRRLLLLFALLLAASPADAAPPRIVAAEQVYGDVAAQIAGPGAVVHSILTNPDQDPHLFEASPGVARALAGARIVILNGLDYDPWMKGLLAANPVPGRVVLDAGALAGQKTGANPHVWYLPATMPALSHALEDALAAADPAGAAGYRARAAAFRASLAPIAARIAALHARFAGAPVTATEPVFGDLLDAVGLADRNRDFQIAVMNDTEPGASAIARFEADLRDHRVRLLVYNSQASDPIAAHMQSLAKAAHIPVLGVTETEPPGQSYQRWVLGELDALGHMLGGP